MREVNGDVLGSRAAHFAFWCWPLLGTAASAQLG